MIITLATLTVLSIFFLLTKGTVKRKLQIEYERSLLNGNKNKAKHLGRIYYQTIDKHTKKAKGIANIDKKIIQDFKAFNVMNVA